VKVGDFGLAAEIEKQHDQISKIGNKNFISPEIIKSHKFSSASDIWALGATMYYFIEDDLPFQGEERTKIRKMTNQSIDEKIKKMALWMLESNPEDRPSFQQIKNLQIPFFKKRASFRL
jgi:serine/threonine protein kinase